MQFTLKEEHKPLLRYRIISILACILLIVAFLLLLLVGISLPIVKPIYLLVLRATTPQIIRTSIATDLKFGVWGMCASSTIQENALCIGPRLGYEIPESIIRVSGFPGSVIEVVQQALFAVLILHPIAAAFVFVSMFTSLFLASRAFSIFTLVLTVISAILSTVVMGVDLSLVLTAINKVRDLNPRFGLEVEFGNGVWMIVAAVVLVWVAVVLLSARACYCCGVRRYKHHHHADCEKGQS